MSTGLPAVASVLAVCAHPDDESFGLGAVLGAFAEGGARTAVVCLTHGEASTLGEDQGDLAVLRAAEVQAAAGALGVTQVELFDHPDGGLAELPTGVLVDQVRLAAERVGAEMLLVFDQGGITGHPDHCAATTAALAAADHHDLPVLAWAVPLEVARVLNEEFHTAFLGRGPEELDLALVVDRLRQQEAIACHTTQSLHNPVLWRRLELQGGTEVLRWLRSDPRGA